MLVVDPWHWLDEDGSLPEDNLRLRRRILRVARFIENGGPLKTGERRETLIECSRRPSGKQCLGLMWVCKTERDTIEGYCIVCRHEEVMIHNWQQTEWAEGPMEAVTSADLGLDDGEPELN